MLGGSFREEDGSGEPAAKRARTDDVSDASEERGMADIVKSKVTEVRLMTSSLNA